MAGQTPTGRSLLEGMLRAAEGVVEELAPKKRQGAEVIVVCGGASCQQKLRLEVKTLFTNTNHRLTIRCPKCHSLTTWLLNSTTTPPAN